MKHTLRSTIIIMFYLLAVCTMLSFKIEELMTVQVTTTSNIQLPAESLFFDENGCHLYEVGSQSYWKNGPYAQEISPSDYSITYKDGFIPYSVTPQIWRSEPIRFSSRALTDGILIDVLKQQETAADQYLIIFPSSLGELGKLPSAFHVEVQADPVWLVSVPNASQPFMENQVRTQLAYGSGEMIKYFTDIDTSDVQIYSLSEIEQFTGDLLRLTVLLVLILFPVLLWFFHCILLRGRKKPKYLPVLNLVLAGADLAAMSYVLSRIDLPSSLLPVHHIFDWSHYISEFTAFWDAAANFQEYGPIQALAQRTAQTQQMVPVILLLGCLFFAAAAAAESAVVRKIAQGGKPSVR